MFDTEQLLSGPRGRRLCWGLLADAISDSERSEWERVWHAAQSEADLTEFLDDLATCVAGAGTGGSLMTAFGDAVGWAAYWQPPDNEDRALASAAVRERLLPIAEAVTGDPATGWWSAPVELGHQVHVEWIDPDTHPVSLSGAAGKLAQWRARTVADEQQAARDRPDDPSAPFSGCWWSTPAMSGLTATTRTVPGDNAVGLNLIEDSLGWTRARCWPVLPHRGARIYEISGPGEWTELVSRYPLDVSKARRHDWWRATGLDSSWLIPDFAAVAADYDAVHLTAAGYLTTAGRGLPAGNARTVLAGWDPDKTYWLADVLTGSGPAGLWERAEQEWRPARTLSGDPGE